MIPTTDRFDLKLNPPANPADDTRPQFVDDSFAATDDLGDWWLDLGHIDLPA